MLHYFMHILTYKILNVDILRLTKKRVNYFISICIDIFILIVYKCNNSRMSRLIHIQYLK